MSEATGGSHPYRSTIPPVPAGTSRPVWSVMIPTYNCAGYLRETLVHVLDQAPGPELMQIEVVDDHSTVDDPAAVVAEVGQGRVGFYRQRENVGHIKNFETCLKRSRGTLIHLLHGDDFVQDGFYRQMQHAFEQSPDIGAAFCRHYFLEEHNPQLALSPLEQADSGILDNWLERLASEQRIMTPSIVVRREAYEKLGGFDSRLLCAEDWEMWIRIAAHYPIWYEVEPLAVYRMHAASNTGRHVRSGAEKRYTRLAIDIFRSYLPQDMAEPATRRARETYALATLGTAYSMFALHDMMAGIVHIREALKFRCSLRVIGHVARLFMRTGLNWTRQLAGGDCTKSD